MKKRSRESISLLFPDSKSLNNISGIKSYSKDGVKKPKPNMKQGASHKQTMSRPITKDKEEVVETLFALAGMFPNNVASDNDKSKLDHEYLEVDPSALPEPKETHTLVFEVVKDKFAIGPLTSTEAANLSCSAERSAETVYIDSLSKPSIQDQIALLDSKKLRIEMDNFVLQLNLHSLSLSTKSEEFNFGISSEVSPYAGLKQPPEQETSLLEIKPTIALGLIQNCSLACRQLIQVVLELMIHVCSPLLLKFQLGWILPCVPLEAGWSKMVLQLESIGNAMVEKNSNGAESGNLHQRRLHKEQPQSTLHSKGCTYQKQSFDFLSLSAGVGGLEANDSFGTAKKGLDTFSQLQVPSLPSLVQNQTPLPLYFPPSHYSSAYPDYSSTQQAQLQLPPYHSSPFYGFQANSTALTKQRPQQQ